MSSDVWETIRDGREGGETLRGNCSMKVQTNEKEVAKSKSKEGKDTDFPDGLRFWKQG